MEGIYLPILSGTVPAAAARLPRLMPLISLAVHVGVNNAAINKQKAQNTIKYNV
jgi:hypothetical protein